MLELRVNRFLRKHPRTQKKRNRFFVPGSPYKVKLPTKFSKELCRIIGWIHGDGNMSLRRIHITDRCEEFHETINTVFEKVFGVRMNLFKDKNRGSFYSHLKCSLIYDYLTEVLELPRGSVRENLRLPSYFRSLEITMKEAYVGGLYDAEGHVKKRQAEIDFTTTSKELYWFVTKLLKELKIPFSTYKRHRHKNPEYEIYIYGKKNLKKFCSHIRILHPEKQKRLNKFFQPTKYPVSPSRK